MWCGLPEECLPARLSSFVEDTFKYHNIVKSREKLLKTNTTSSKMDSEDSERNGYWRISHEADGIINFQSNRPLIDVNLSRVFPNAPSDPTIPPRSLSTEKSHCHLYIPKEKSNQSSSANLERGLRLSCDGGEENCPNLSMYLTYHDHRRGEFLAGKMHGKNLAFSRLDAIFAQHLEKLNSVFLIATKINPLSSTHSARDVQNKSTRILRDYGVEHKTFSCSSKISMESPQSKLSLSTASGLLGFQTLSKGFKITDRARLSLGGELFYNPMETGVGGLSLGSRLVTNKRSPQTGEERCKGETITTTVINPIMGHLQTSFTAQLTNSIRAAARYDLNFYSGDSDVALGALIFNCTGDLIRLRCSWRHGLALSLTMANHPSSSHVNESKCIDLFKGQNLVDSKEKNIIGLMTRHAKESKTVQVNSKPDESKDPTRVKITLGLATGPLLIQSALEPESIPTPASFACRPSINLSVFLEH